MRKRASCDACHLRKTKCDLLQQQAMAQSACTFCRSLRIDCRISPAEPTPAQPTAQATPQRKHGKRIRALLAAEAKIGPQLTHGPLGAGGTSDASTSRRPAGLMGVAGLSVTRLRRCVHAFLDTLGLWMPLTEDRAEFLARFELFVRHAQGLIDDDSDDDVEPASELLVLAVAARGAIFTRPDGAELADALRARFAALVHLPDRLYAEGVDGIEAVTLINESGVRPLHPIAAGGKHADCLSFDVFGKGFPSELCLFSKLNEEATVASTSTSKEDYLRRCRLFWTVYCHDAIRSASARRMYRLHDDDIGWPLYLEPGENPAMYLAQLARTLCRVMLSARAQMNGVDVGEATRLIEDLTKWPQETGMTIEQARALSMSTADHQLRVKLALLLTLALRLSLSVWTAIHTNERGVEASKALLRARADTHAERAVVIMVQLADVLIEYSLIDYGPTALLGTCAAWLLYIVNTMPHYSSTPAQAAQRVTMADRLLVAIRSVKVHTEQAFGLADVLEGMLRGGGGGTTQAVGTHDIDNIAENSTMTPTSLLTSDRPAKNGARWECRHRRIRARRRRQRPSLIWTTRGRPWRSPATPTKHPLATPRTTSSTLPRSCNPSTLT